MPLDEEGAKWSCEPCIRGHRSSKCQHFDRLMMKVPKAGRPLAKCPHPKGTCSCQKTFALMVRIPKGSSCVCRPLYKVPATPNDSDQSTPASVPQVASPAPGKVQKSTRRQSHIHAAPEKIAKALEAIPDKLKLEDGASNYLAGLPQHQPDLNGHHSPNPNGTYSAAPAQDSTNDTPPKASCCSQKPSPPPVPPVAPSAGGSCCGAKSSASVTPNHPNGQQSKSEQSNAWNGMSYSNFPQQSPWGNSMASTQPSFMQPFGLQTVQSPQFYMGNYAPNVSSASYQDLMNGLGIPQSSMAQFGAHSQTNYAPAATSGDGCHDCKCGEDCQCLGCAAHPFNNTTRQHVQEMGVMMTFDGDEHTPEAIATPYQMQSYPSNTAITPLNLYMHQQSPMDNGMHQNQNVYESYSDPNSTMPSGYSSPQTTHQMNQQLMHPSEYYTLEYPVGIPSACSDITGSCQCGMDCACVGCLTHSGHNGVHLDTSIPETPIGNTEHQISSGMVVSPSNGSHTSRIPAMGNVPVPCMSPQHFQTSMI
ncbi:hypothetical protein N7490_010266 [Penicillium lividum]|nr:hypothetical protein N7490_010266 [Penicillium lividum]